jgi:nucleoside-diphosphate-sugar epimerase
MHLLLFGATGMVGNEVLHLALADPRINAVTTIGRRATGVTHKKLTEVVHADQLALAPLAETIGKADLIVYCVGVYQNAVSKEAFWTITCDYLAHLLAELKRLGKDPVFCLMGAQGADPTEKTPFRFGKAKGRAERLLMESHLTRKYIFRPGYIEPGRVQSRSTIPEWISRPMFRLFPSLGIESVNLAKVMLETGLTKPAQVLYTNGEMRVLAANFMRSSGWASSARR